MYIGDLIYSLSGFILAQLFTSNKVGAGPESTQNNPNYKTSSTILSKMWYITKQLIPKLIFTAMQIIGHNKDNINTAEIVSDELLIVNPDDTLQLIVDMYYQGYDRIVISEKNITPDFFDLKTRLAGEILQKFVNYKMRLIIVGDFDKYASQNIKDFIFESNKGIQINFVKTFP